MTTMQPSIGRRGFLPCSGSNVPGSGGNVPGSGGNVLETAKREMPVKVALCTTGSKFTFTA